MAIDAIDDAVMAKLQGDATLLSLAPGNVWADSAPEGAIDIGRFVIVNLQLEQVTHEEGGVAYVVPQYQVKVVDRSTTKTAAQAALDRIDTLLHNAPLTIAGHTHMISRRVGRFAFKELEGPNTWQHRGAEYEVWADPI